MNFCEDLEEVVAMVVERGCKERTTATEDMEGLAVADTTVSVEGILKRLIQTLNILQK